MRTAQFGMSPTVQFGKWKNPSQPVVSDKALTQVRFGQSKVDDLADAISDNIVKLSEVDVTGSINNIKDSCAEWIHKKLIHRNQPYCNGFDSFKAEQELPKLINQLSDGLGNGDLKLLNVQKKNDKTVHTVEFPDKSIHDISVWGERSEIVDIAQGEYPNRTQITIDRAKFFDNTYIFVKKSLADGTYPFKTMLSFDWWSAMDKKAAKPFADKALTLANKIKKAISA